MVHVDGVGSEFGAGGGFEEEDEFVHLERDLRVDEAGDVPGGFGEISKRKVDEPEGGDDTRHRAEAALGKSDALPGVGGVGRAEGGGKGTRDDAGGSGDVGGVVDAGGEIV